MTILTDRNATQTTRAGSKCKRLDPNDEDQIETRHVAVVVDGLKRNVYSSRSAQAAQRNVQDRAPLYGCKFNYQLAIKCHVIETLCTLRISLFFLNSFFIPFFVLPPDDFSLLQVNCADSYHFPRIGVVSILVRGRTLFERGVQSDGGGFKYDLFNSFDIF